MLSRTGRSPAVGGIGQLALLPAAAFAVHQLRYVLAYGAASGAELQRTGHSYLHSLVPWLVALIALATGCFLRALGRALSGRTSMGWFTCSFAGLWAACVGALLAIFFCQELLEGVFATGHPAGLAGVFGYGGWWAIPAAACIGLVLAAVFHGASWAVREVARRWSTRTAPPPRRIVAARRPQGVAVLGPAPLLGGWSSRGPPS
jgi:hypothetical protein